MWRNETSSAPCTLSQTTCPLTTVLLPGQTIIIDASIQGDVFCQHYFNIIPHRPKHYIIRNRVNSEQGACSFHPKFLVDDL